LLTNVPYFTTMAAAIAVCDAGVSGRSLQEWAAR